MGANMEDLKEFSYKECIKFSEDKTKYIEALLRRLDSYHKVVSIMAEKEVVVCPKALLKKFSIIDARYPIVMGWEEN